MVRQIRRHRIRNNKLNKFALLTQNHLMICLSNASYLYNNACILLGLPLTELAFVNKTPTYVCWAILQFFLRNALYWIFSWVIFNDWYNWKFLNFSSFVMSFLANFLLNFRLIILFLMSLLSSLDCIQILIGFVFLSDAFELLLILSSLYVFYLIMVERSGILCADLGFVPTFLVW